MEACFLSLLMNSVKEFLERICSVKRDIRNARDVCNHRPELASVGNVKPEVWFSIWKRALVLDLDDGA